MSHVPFPPMKRPLIAILRGVKPEEAEGIVTALIEAGLTAIEIPLNSPDPFRSIEIAVRVAPDNVLIGAGTVLTVEAVERLHDLGGRLLVTPNVDAEVIGRAQEWGLVTVPGVFTPTEALLAAKAGASSLKFFPASVLGASGISAIHAVLPSDLMIAAVGGVSDRNFIDYMRAGIHSFGLGTSLYKPGMTVAEIAERARSTIHAYDIAIQSLKSVG
jgi:2-dehydro-3-deoxyphosphogalactonate aldolase